jgi:hypothetical protein
MANIRPTTIFGGYTADGTGLTIPFSAIPGLTAAEAHPTTGDAREIIRLILEKYFIAIQALPVADRPISMSINRGSLVGLDSVTVRRSYQLSFDESVAANATAMKAEP